MIRGVVLVVTLAVVAAGALGLAEAQTPAVDLTLSDLDQAQAENVRLREQLRVARAQRADCETTLGPIEVAARGAENQRAAEDLKRAIEARHPGTEYDIASGTLRKKPEPPSTPKKDEETKK